MDTYLPADFRKLHDSAPDDWRDAPSAWAREYPSAADATHDLEERERINRCADPQWRVF